MRARYVFGFIALAAFVYAPLPGCSNEGEGQQCSVDNNSDDCQTGLVCTPHATLMTAVDICCPSVAPSNPACIPGALGTASSSSSSSSSSVASSSSAGGAGGGGNAGGGNAGGGGGGASSTAHTSTTGSTGGNGGGGMGGAGGAAAGGGGTGGA